MVEAKCLSHTDVLQLDKTLVILFVIIIIIIIILFLHDSEGSELIFLIVN